MAYADLPAVAAGQVIAEAWGNQVRANFAAGPNGLATTAGQIFYATGVGALAPLAIGTPGQPLTVNPAGDAPAWGSDLTLPADAARVISVNRVTSAIAGKSLTLKAGGAQVGATNTDGGTLFLSGGISTGSGGSSIDFQIASGGGGGTTDHAPATIMRLSGVVFGPLVYGGLNLGTSGVRWGAAYFSGIVEAVGGFSTSGSVIANGNILSGGSLQCSGSRPIDSHPSVSAMRINFRLAVADNTDSIMIGNPTGSLPGGGGINTVGNIFLNGTQYTNPDYALEHAFTGKIEAFADREGANGYPGLTSLKDVETYARKHFQLPQIARFNAMLADPECGTGLFTRADAALELIEEIFLHLFDVNQRINALEARP